MLRLLRRYAGQHLLRWHKDKVREACAPPVEGRPRRLFPGLTRTRLQAEFRQENT
ncbi:hypothetical protein P4233_08855 [Pseudomonas aeruginosa]|nr:hypothetical protein [Pseudomonas aeruginosa]